MWLSDTKEILDDNFGETFVPDIVFKNNKKNELHIYDAKYYETDFDEEGRVLNANAGIGDISKQLFYMRSILDFIMISYRKRDKKKI